MTEQGWLTSNDPAVMLDYLIRPFDNIAAAAFEPARPLRISDRKLRLFCVACFSLSYGHERALSDGGYASWDSGEPDRDDGKDSPLVIAQSWVETDDTAAGEITRAEKAALLRDIVGNPFRPLSLCECCWKVLPAGDGNHCHGCGHTVCVGCCEAFGHLEKNGHLLPASPVRDLAHAAYKNRGRMHPMPSGGGGRVWRDDGTLDPFRLTILADVLEEERCTEETILRHLHGEEPCLVPHHAHDWRKMHGPHVRGCWVVDLLLGKQ
jgi:hypothetical protein